MEKNYQFLNMDINKPINRKLTAIQYDNKSRYILVSVFSNFIPYDLTYATVKIYGIKGDKTVFFNNAKIVDAKKGQFEIDLTEQCLAVAGDVEIQILILGANKERLSSNSFVLTVKKSIIDAVKVTSQSEWNALTEGLSNLAEYDIYKNNVLKHENEIQKTKNDIMLVGSQLKDIAINVKNFGAKLDGITDDSQSIQNALNYAKDNDSKTVLVPYSKNGCKISNNISIPKGVKIKGEGTCGPSYLSGGEYGQGVFTKTYFICDDYNGDAPLISISDNSTIEQLGFYYKTVNTKLAVGDVPCFPFTIYGNGIGYTLRDLSIIGASHFIKCDSFERCTIDNINGLITKNAFVIKRSRDVSRITNIHINPNIVFPRKDGVENSEFWSEHFKHLLKRDLVIFTFGSSDYYYLENILTYGCNTFLKVVPENYNDSFLGEFDDYPFTMMGNNILADNTIKGLVFQRNISFTSKLVNLTLVPIDDTGVGIKGVGIEVNQNTTGLLSITNMLSKGTDSQTNKHIVLNSTSAFVINILNARLIGPGDNSNTTTFEDMFTVNGNNKLKVEMVFTKTNSVGKYKTVIYENDFIHHPGGIQFKNFAVNDDTQYFKVSKIDGADKTKDVLSIDEVGGIIGSFSKLIENNSTEVYNLKSKNNSNGRGIVLIVTDAPHKAFGLAFSNGSELTPIFAGEHLTISTSNLRKNENINIFMSSAGVIGINNLLGSTRNVSIILFPSI